MNQQTKDQIAREAEKKFPSNKKGSKEITTKVWAEQRGYIAGAETWAERGEVLKVALEKIKRCCNAGAGGGPMDRVLQDILSITNETLSNFNNPVK